MARGKKLETLAKKGNREELIEGILTRIAKEMDATTDPDVFTDLVKAFIGVTKVSQTIENTDTPDRANNTVLELVRRKKKESA